MLTTRSGPTTSSPGIQRTMVGWIFFGIIHKHFNWFQSIFQDKYFNFNLKLYVSMLKVEWSICTFPARTSGSRILSSITSKYSEYSKCSRHFQSCKMSILLHGSKPSNQILPKKTCKLQQFWHLNLSKLTKNYFWWTTVDHRTKFS